MSFVRCTSWPKVLPDDGGIRPAGNLHRCFYCGQEVGEPHGAECVTVVNKTRYGVYMNGDRVGTFLREDPFYWSNLQREFHKNESSWCADNAWEAIEWASDDARVKAEAATEDCCACGVLEFRVDEIEDAGPFVEIEKKKL